MFTNDLFTHITFAIAVVYAIISHITFNVSLTLKTKKLNAKPRKTLAHAMPGLHADEITLGFKDIKLTITIK